jgi:hypothetical protein
MSSLSHSVYPLSGESLLGLYWLLQETFQSSLAKSLSPAQALPPQGSNFWLLIDLESFQFSSVQMKPIYTFPWHSKYKPLGVEALILAWMLLGGASQYLAGFSRKATSTCDKLSGVTLPSTSIISLESVRHLRRRQDPQGDFLPTGGC